MIEGLIDRVLEYAQTSTFQKKIHCFVIDPLLAHVFEKLYPYILFIGIIFGVFFLLLFIIGVTILRSL